MVKAVRTVEGATLDGWGVERDEGPDEITFPRSRRAGRKMEGPGQLAGERSDSVDQGADRSEERESG